VKSKKNTNESRNEDERIGKGEWRKEEDGILEFLRG
jgi:hypothetical protein